MTTSQLNQIIAVEKSVREQYNEGLQNIANYASQEKFFNGVVRTYTPVDDEGDRLPDEFSPVAFRVIDDLIPPLRQYMSRLFDVVATKDFGNANVNADVELDAQTLLQNVPVPYLLFLEKELVRLNNVIMSLPTLPINDQWEWSAEHNAYQSATRRTTRTEKVMRNHVKAEATQQHPAQVEVYTEDQVVGYWDTTRLNGAISVLDRNTWSSRVDELLRAVRFARERANSNTIDNQRIADSILGFIFD